MADYSMSYSHHLLSKYIFPLVGFCLQLVVTDDSDHKAQHWSEAINQSEEKLKICHGRVE